jgi:hypothetical protein
VQSVKPASHWQTPLEHPVVKSGSHVRPHAPQLSVLVLVSTQAPLQVIWPVGHWQAPPTQLVPFWQLRPQKPQFAGSVARFTHDPLHWNVPAGHPQVPLVHVCPPVQSASATHSTHVFVVVLHIGVPPPQSDFWVHSTQTFVVVLQTGVPG